MVLLERFEMGSKPTLFGARDYLQVRNSLEGLLEPFKN